MDEKNKWLVPIANKVANEFDEHDKGFILVPFSRTESEAKKNRDNDSESIMMTNLENPNTFGAAITFAILTYCRQLNADLGQMLNAINKTAETMGKRGGEGQTIRINTETGEIDNEEKVLHVDIDQLMHPSRYAKGKDKDTWDEMSDWSKDAIKTVENEVLNHDSTYSMVIATKEGDSRAYAVSGYSSTADLVCSIGALIQTAVANRDMDIDTVVELSRKVAETMLGDQDDQE